MPVWTDFSLSRVREVTRPTLPTTGHIISHGETALRERLADIDELNHVLILDDTSFSGATSLLVEDLLRKATPERAIDFTHGFLLLNNGKLGTTPGAKERLSAIGSKAVGGMAMHTPSQDGWHFFDIAKQPSIEEHLPAMLELAKLAARDNFIAEATDFLADENRLKAAFPNALSSDELRDKQKLGHFIATKAIDGTFHSSNPQLLPSIIRQGHLRPPVLWKHGEEETLDQLLHLNKLIKRSTHV